MTIRLRIVGIFFDDNSIPFDPNDSIKEVLDKAVVRSAGRLVYSSDRRFDSATSTVVETIRGFRHTTGLIDPTLGGRARPAGTYELDEQVTVNGASQVVRAWQYYVIRAGAAVSNASDGASNFDVSPVRPNVAPNVPGFTAFTAFKVQDGDEITWRNVSIVRTPNA